MVRNVIKLTKGTVPPSIEYIEETAATSISQIKEKGVKENISSYLPSPLAHNNFCIELVNCYVRQELAKE